jgi:hypothetical protein
MFPTGWAALEAETMLCSRKTELILKKVRNVLIEYSRLILLSLTLSLKWACIVQYNLSLFFLLLPLWRLLPLLVSRADFSVSWLFTDGRAPWTGDQLGARPLPKHRTTQTQNKRIHTSNIHALNGIRTHDPGFRASEDSSCLRPLGGCVLQSVGPGSSSVTI